MSEHLTLALVTSGNPLDELYCTIIEEGLEAEGYQNAKVVLHAYEDVAPPNAGYGVVIVVHEPGMDEADSFVVYEGWRRCYPGIPIIWFTGEPEIDYSYLENLSNVRRYDLDRNGPSREMVIACILDALQASSPN